MGEDVIGLFLIDCGEFFKSSSEFKEELDQKVIDFI